MYNVVGDLMGAWMSGMWGVLMPSISIKISSHNHKLKIQYIYFYNFFGEFEYLRRSCGNCL